MKNKKLSVISLQHYIKLVARSILFASAAILYIINRINKTGNPFGGLGREPLILGAVWCIFFVEMLLRFFPSRIESMGCQKQFKRNYISTGKTYVPDKDERCGVIVSALAWIALNTVIAVLYYTEIIDAGILILISLAYSVCDMICILFFCPFQTWFMKNKCCGTCRIYNWDYAMMFTPLLFIPHFYTWSLLFGALVLLVRWELAAHIRRERFSEETNACLSCKNCREKLCSHKKQLRRYLRYYYKRVRK